MMGLSRTRSLLVLLCVGIGLCGSAVLLVLSQPETNDASEDTVRWDETIEVASGGGFRGPWRMNDSDWRFVDDPTVAIGRYGTTRVAWTDHTAQDLYLQSYGPNGRPQFDRPTNVSQTPTTFSWLPRMVVSDKDPATIYLLWQEIIFSGGTHGGDILFARSTDGGRSFSTPENLSQSPAGDGKGRLTAKRWHNGSLDLIVAPDHTLFAAWTEYEGRLWVSRSTNRGRTFSAPVHVAGTQKRPARGPALAAGPPGRVHLTWTVGENPTADIAYTRTADSTIAFDPPRPIAESRGYSDAPKIAVDADGTVHVAYGERPAGPDRSPHIRYTHSTTGDSFAPPTTVSRGDPGARRGAQFPYLRVPSPETVMVAWERLPPGRGRPDALGYTTSRDGGDTFRDPTVIPGTDTTGGFNGSQQGFLMEKLDVTRDGAVAVVNSTFERNEASHIWLYRGTLHRD